MNINREVLGTSKVTSKFQLTLPKKTRERFKIKDGDTLVFLEFNGELVIKKSTDI